MATLAAKTPTTTCAHNNQLATPEKVSPNTTHRGYARNHGRPHSPYGIREIVGMPHNAKRSAGVKLSFILAVSLVLIASFFCADFEGDTAYDETEAEELRPAEFRSGLGVGSTERPGYGEGVDAFEEDCTTC